MVKPPSEQSGPRNPSRPVKVMSIDGLKRALRYSKYFCVHCFSLYSTINMNFCSEQNDGVNCEIHKYVFQIICIPLYCSNVNSEGSSSI
jgi:hypothetical protein